MPKRTYQPKKKKRIRKLGYRARKRTPSGRRILKRRKKKGRKKLTISDEFRIIGKKPKMRKPRKKNIHRKKASIKPKPSKKGKKKK